MDTAPEELVTPIQTDQSVHKDLHAGVQGNLKEAGIVNHQTVPTNHETPLELGSEAEKALGIPTEKPVETHKKEGGNLMENLRHLTPIGQVIGGGLTRYVDSREPLNLEKERWLKKKEQEEKKAA